MNYTKSFIRDRKMKNLKYFCSFTIALFLCMRVSWADQSGMVTIKLPKYMADFFAPVPSARIAEEHKMIFIAHYNGLDERYLAVNTPRSEERRVGKECRSRWS